MPEESDSTDYVGGLGALSREMMAAMLDQSEDCVKVLDPLGRVDFINRNGRCIMEIGDFCLVARQPWDNLWPEESRDRVRAAIAAAQAGRSDRFEAFCPTAKGTPKWWEVSVSPVRDAAGETFAILSISRDVTERHQSLESMETMAHEMRHRLRNAFAVSGAIALASGRDEPAHHAFAQTLAQRYNSLAMAQSRLLDGGEEQTLRTLAEIITEAFDRGRGLVRIGELPGDRLSDQQMRLVALVIGELCTNSIKHGALHFGLPVDLSARRGDGTLILDWAETLVPDMERNGGGTGSGYGLMDRMARAYGGSFSATLGRERLDAQLAVPIG